MERALSKQEQRAVRELEIIQCTLTLLAEKGFLELKMADVAKMAGYSMGVIYSHFASKEDLLLGCACVQIRIKQQLLLTFEKQELTVEQRLVLLPLFICEHIKRHPEAYEVMSLAALPSLWKRASSHRVNELNQLGQQTLSLLTPKFEAWLQHYQQSSRHAQPLFCGLIGLVVGLWNLQLSGLGLLAIELDAFHDGNPLYSNLCRFYRGWGIELHLSSEQWQQLQQLAIDTIEQAPAVLTTDFFAIT